VSTLQKWIRENKSMQMMTWLRFNKCDNNASHVSSFCCSVCQKFGDRLRGMKNYSPAFVIEASNL